MTKKGTFETCRFPPTQRESSFSPAFEPVSYGLNKNASLALFCSRFFFTTHELRKDAQRRAPLAACYIPSMISSISASCCMRSSNSNIDTMETCSPGPRESVERPSLKHRHILRDNILMKGCLVRMRENSRFLLCPFVLTPSVITTLLTSHHASLAIMQELILFTK